MRPTLLWRRSSEDRSRSSGRIHPQGFVGHFCVPEIQIVSPRSQPVILRQRRGKEFVRVGRICKRIDTAARLGTFSRERRRGRVDPRCIRDWRRTGTSATAAAGYGYKRRQRHERGGNKSLLYHIIPHCSFLIGLLRYVTIQP